MTQHLPEWVMKRYALLWKEFGKKEFSKSDAEKVMPKDSATAVCFSEMRKAGWVEMKLDEKDARKTIYKLKNPEQAIKEELKELSG